MGTLPRGQRIGGVVAAQTQAGAIRRAEVSAIESIAIDGDLVAHRELLVDDQGDGNIGPQDVNGAAIVREPHIKDRP